MTQKTLDRMPKNVIYKLDDIKARRKNGYWNWKEANARAYEYTLGLMDAGFITDKERQILFLYTTV